jgi:hypothetical protein
MAPPIMRRKRAQWKEELRRIRRMIEAAQLEVSDDVALTADLIGRLEGAARVLEHWIDSIRCHDDDSCSELRRHVASRSKIRVT